MRKLYSLLASFLFASFAFVVPAFSFNEPTEPGTKQEMTATADEGVRVYRLVRNPNQTPAGVSAPNAIMNSRDAVLWDTISDDNCTVNYPSFLGITTSIDSIAGIVVGTIPTADVGTGTATNSLSRTNWGYIQVYGKCFASVEASGITVGQGFKAAIGDSNIVAGGVNATGGAGGSYGFSYDTDADGGDTEIFVRTQ